MPANPVGVPSSQEAEDVFTAVLQSAATGNGNGTPAIVSGYAGAQVLEVNNAGSGSCTLSIEGSFDGSTWYAVGYYQVDGIAAPARSVSSISITASPFAHVYSVLDTYNQIRARISGTSGNLNLTCTLRANPV